MPIHPDAIITISVPNGDGSYRDEGLLLSDLAASIGRVALRALVASGQAQTKSRQGDSPDAKAPTAARPDKPTGGDCPVCLQPKTQNKAGHWDCSPCRSKKIRLSLAAKKAERAPAPEPVSVPVPPVVAPETPARPAGWKSQVHNPSGKKPPRAVKPRAFISDGESLAPVPGIHWESSHLRAVLSTALASPHMTKDRIFAVVRSPKSENLDRMTAKRCTAVDEYEEVLFTVALNGADGEGAEIWRTGGHAGHDARRVFPDGRTEVWA